MRHFASIDLDLSGSTVGSTVTFYTAAVVSDPDVKLGDKIGTPREPFWGTSTATGRSTRRITCWSNGTYWVLIRLHKAGIPNTH